MIISLVGRQYFADISPMKYVSQLLLIVNLFFANNVYANGNIFELIAPSSYKPVNLLKELELIDSGSYRLNLYQKINSIFPDHEITDAALYIVLPNSCMITNISADYKVHRRTDYSYYVFEPIADEVHRTFDVSMGLKTATVNAKEFGFIVIARNDQGKTLVHNGHDNNMYKDIVMQEYLSKVPDAEAR